MEKTKADPETNQKEIKQLHVMSAEDYLLLICLICSRLGDSRLFSNWLPYFGSCRSLNIKLFIFLVLFSVLVRNEKNLFKLQMTHLTASFHKIRFRVLVITHTFLLFLMIKRITVTELEVLVSVCFHKHEYVAVHLCLWVLSSAFSP